MTDREDRVREIAYFLWLEAGSPEGEAESHWLTAESFLKTGPAEEERVEGGASDAPKKPFPRATTLGSDCLKSVQ